MAELTKQEIAELDIFYSGQVMVSIPILKEKAMDEAYVDAMLDREFEIVKREFKQRVMCALGLWNPGAFGGIGGGDGSGWTPSHS